MTDERFLIVRRISDRREVHRVDVTGRGESHIDRVTAGMLRNLADGLYVADSADESEISCDDCGQSFAAPEATVTTARDGAGEIETHTLCPSCADENEERHYEC